MKFKRIVSKILACAMVVTSVYTGNVANVNAAENDMTIQPIAKYDFETEDNYQDITKLVAAQGHAAYTGELNIANSGYNSNKSFSMELDAPHVLQLPQKNLTEYTVSLRIWNQYNTLNSGGSTYVVMSIGTSDRYVSIKAPDNTNGRYVQLFSMNEAVSDDIMGVTSGGFYANEWRTFTITQSGNKVTAYLDGEEKMATTLKEGGSLLGANGSILIGAQQDGAAARTWAKFDDISVWDKALNAKQVKQLYKGETVTQTEDWILDKEGITVSPTDGAILKGETVKVEAILPAGVPANTDGLQISYASSNTAAATVDANGLVTAVNSGETEITVTATIGGVSKSAKIKLTVADTKEDVLKATKEINVSKNLTCAVNGTAQIEVKLPIGIEKDDVEISYAVSPDDGGVAEVNDKGEVTGKEGGESQVVTSVKIGSTTRTGTTAVKVLSEVELLEKGEIAVTPNVRIKGTGNATLKVELPEGLTENDVDISYKLKDGAATGVATVDAATGVVTGTAAGGRTIVTTTVKATTGDKTATKTADTIVKVLPTAVDANVVVEYDLSAVENGKLVDISNHGNDGVIKGDNWSFEITEEEDIMTLGDNTWIELPKSIVGENGLTSTEKFTIEAKFAKNSSCGKNAWLFCLGTNTNTNYLFVSPNYGNPGILRSGIKNDTAASEILFETAKQTGNDVFHTVDMVFDEGVVTLYMDGIQMIAPSGKYSIESGYKAKDDIIDKNTTDETLGFIGKSLWEADGFYQGKLSSFKIYDSARTPQQIQGEGGYQEAFTEEVNASLTDEKFVADYLGSKNTSKDAIVYDMSLPKTLNENAVTWSFSPEGIIEADGKVNNDETADKTVELTATVTSGSLSATKKFTVTVKKADKAALTKAVEDAQAEINTGNYTMASVATLQTYLDQAATVKGQTRIDTLVSRINAAAKNLKVAPGDHDPFGKISTSDYKTSVSLVPTKTTTVFTLPGTLTLDTDVTVSYESSNPSVASVDPITGVVTAQKKCGTATITTKVKALWEGLAGEEKEYKTTVKVDVNTKKATAKAKATKLAKGKTTTIAITPSADMKTAGYTVAYKATGAVSVTKKGKVTAKKAGTGKVTVTMKSAGKTVTKTISITVGELTGKASVKVKKSITLKVTGIKGTVKWSLDKKGKKLATISKKGKLTAKKKKGKVVVTAKVGGVTMTKTITIKK